MAKNYTFNEAVKIIAKGTDLEAITDIGRRYPVLAHKIAVVTAKAGDEFVDLMGYMPDYLTANKVNTAIKAGITESGSDDEGTEDTEVEAEATTEEKSAEEVDYNKFNGDTLINMCKERGIYERGMKKAALVKALEDYDENGGSNTADEEESAGTETGNPYEGKSAMELFKECKERGIKVAPKKPAKFYVDLLIKDDAAKAEATEAESDDEDWGEPDENPKKEDKKAAPKASAKGGKAKAAKKAKAESEDDEDWDI